jgi:pectate lyase
VGGTIVVDSDIKINNPYITIAGQTAPGGGITLRNNPSSQMYTTLDIRTHDVILRYLTIRPGPPPATGGGDAVGIGTQKPNVYNLMIDHCSFSWAVDEVFCTWYAVKNISIQWSLFSEGLNCSTHPKGCHSKGVLLGSHASDEKNTQLGAANISFHHNLLAHNVERNPWISASGLVDVVNNVIYNPDGTFSHVCLTSKSIMPVNYVGNYFKPGPNTIVGGPKYEVKTKADGGYGAAIYLKGNIGPRRTSDSLPETACIAPESLSYVVETRHAAAAVRTTSAAEAYTTVLNEAGAKKGLDCSGRFFDRRDAIDSRVVMDVRNGTGKVINHPSEVGGWLTVAGGDACIDSDHDGMPDGWEQAQGLNPNDPTDRNLDPDGDGYTKLEEYLNGANPKGIIDNRIPISIPKNLRIADKH